MSKYEKPEPFTKKDIPILVFFAIIFFLMVYFSNGDGVPPM